jgi:hypothetical protein
MQIDVEDCLEDCLACLEEVVLRRRLSEGENTRGDRMEKERTSILIIWHFFRFWGRSMDWELSCFFIVSKA